MFRDGLYTFARRFAMYYGNKLLLNQVGQDLTVVKGIGLTLVIADRSNDRNSPISGDVIGAQQNDPVPRL